MGLFSKDIKTMDDLFTRYGSLIAWAKQLGRNDACRVLEQTLEEQKAADKRLTALAGSTANLRAAS